jgi:chromosome segregation ATPase
MPDPSEFDPTRLTALARSRDRQKAQVRALSERYADLREHRVDIDKRLRLARAELANHHGRHGFEIEQQVKQLQGQYDALTSQMAEVLAEQDATAAEATEAGQLFRACLSFATENGLMIPPALAAEAQPKTFAPLSAQAGG